nr:hypothetical protein [uncultured Carboxylicivirga sp.]
MGLFKKSPIANTVEAGTEFLQAANSIIDSTVTTQKQRGTLKNEFAQLFATVQQFVDEQRTARLQSDNEKGSMLTRNIRPIVTLIAVVSFFTTVFMKMDIETVKLTKDIAEICVYFYFGSRGIEKALPVISDYTKSLRRKG